MPKRVQEDVRKPGAESEAPEPSVRGVEGQPGRARRRGGQGLGIAETRSGFGEGPSRVGQRREQALSGRVLVDLFSVWSLRKRGKVKERTRKYTSVSFFLFWFLYAWELGSNGEEFGICVFLSDWILHIEK